LDIRRIGIVSQTSETKPDELARVAAALNLQIIRDFAPVWDVTATVQVYSRIREAPFGTWLIIVRDDIHAGDQTGFHRSKRGLPYAMVKYSHSWSLDASHELLEMLADPSGSELESGLAPGDSFARVDYLREVCDPCQSEDFSYTINTVMVSDFITRRYYDTVKSAGASYSFKGHISGPRELLPGGYLTFRREATRSGARWFDWTEEWYQRHRRAVTVAAPGPLGALAAELADPREQQVGWQTWLELEALRREAVEALGIRP